MPPASQLTDALWHCLCPSFSRPPIARALRTRAWPLKVHRRPASTYLGHGGAVTADEQRDGDDYKDEVLEQQASYGAQNGEDTVPQAQGTYNPMVFPDSNNTIDETVSRATRMGYDNERENLLYKKYVRVGITALYGILETRANMADLLIVQMLVKILVQERGEEMDSRHYHALILANASSAYGSAGEVERLLHQMQENDMPLESDVLHSALKALSIHPDFLLRNQILATLEQYWFPLSQEGWQWVITGMIRDKQVELALEKFQEMQELGMEPDAWFLNFLLTTLLSISAFPEALVLLQMRSEHAEPISTALWSHVLTTAAQSLAHPLVDFVWRRAVAAKFINPSTGTCTDVLASAARHGDYRLATDVFRVLGARSSALHAPHYESLCEAYLRADDLSTALTVLSIMARTPTPPTESGASPLYQYLVQHAGRPPRALALLRELRAADKPVPIAAVNAALNALGQFDALDEALAAYDDLHRLVPAGPTTATFNALLRGCSAAAAKDRAMFLAAEMRARGVAPDALTYDRLILVCAKGRREEDVRDACRYWEEMCGRGWWPRQGTVVALVKALVARREQAVWRVLQENSKRGMDSMALRRWVNDNWPREVVAMYEDPERTEEDGAAGSEASAAKSEAELEEERERKRLARLRGRGGKDMTAEEMEEWKNLT